MLEVCIHVCNVTLVKHEFCYNHQANVSIVYVFVQLCIWQRSRNKK